MITEDYVSFETAKLLKEKGFDEDTICVYIGRHLLIKGEGTISNTTDMPIIPAPTLQMAMKWLREVHKWSIQVFPCFDDLKWWFDIYELKIQEFNSRPELLSDVGYDTYEEATEAAIEYCLTNLI